MLLNYKNIPCVILEDCLEKKGCPDIVYKCLYKDQIIKLIQFDDELLTEKEITDIVQSEYQFIGDDCRSVLPKHFYVYPISDECAVYITSEQKCNNTLYYKGYAVMDMVLYENYY